MADTPENRAPVDITQIKRFDMTSLGITDRRGAYYIWNEKPITQTLIADDSYTLSWRTNKESLQDPVPVAEAIEDLTKAALTESAQRGTLMFDLLILQPNPLFRSLMNCTVTLPDLELQGNNLNFDLKAYVQSIWQPLRSFTATLSDDVEKRFSLHCDGVHGFEGVQEVGFKAPYTFAPTGALSRLIYHTSSSFGATDPSEIERFLLTINTEHGIGART